MNGKNKPNKWYGKLQIKLTDVNAATTIRVDFIKATSAVSPAVASMASWTTTN
jgi:hypothetical protein